MQFQLSVSGTITECREALNAKLAEYHGQPYGTEQAAVRAIANHVVVGYLDPLHDPWQEEVNKARGVGLKTLPPEPTLSVSIDCTVLVGPAAPAKAVA